MKQETFFKKNNNRIYLNKTRTILSFSHQSFYPGALQTFFFSDIFQTNYFFLQKTMA